MPCIDMFELVILDCLLGCFSDAGANKRRDPKESWYKGKSWRAMQGRISTELTE
jgi:hypothetical protein